MYSILVLIVDIDILITFNNTQRLCELIVSINIAICSYRGGVP